jgi:hypothetical protein
MAGIAAFLFLFLTVVGGRSRSVGDLLLCLGEIGLGLLIASLLLSRRLPDRTHAALAAGVAVVLIAGALT